MRKNYFVLLFALLNVCCLSAQSNKMQGKWMDDYYMFKDTIQAGIEEVNSDFEAYREGKKQLKPEFVVVRNREISKDEARVFELKKINKSFWLINTKTKKKWKLVYDKEKEVFVTPKLDWADNYLISYDLANDKLYFDSQFKQGKILHIARSVLKRF